MIHLSVIVPVRNEADHITNVLDRLLEQHYDPNKWEIIVVDGLSTDQTPQIVQEYVQKYPNVIRYFENPQQLSSIARNIGIKNAQGEAVLIVDGHCIIDNSDMFRNVSEAFELTGADCLGRPQPLEMANATSWQWAIAAARRSPLGHHPDSFIYANKAQFTPASSVAIAYRKSVFEKVGYFDENFDACEDVEMNTRIDAAGLKCYFEPAITVRYMPRNTLTGLSSQMNRYGRGRVRLWRKHRHTFSWKSFAPGLLYFGSMLGFSFCAFYAMMVLFAPAIFRVPGTCCTPSTIGNVLTMPMVIFCLVFLLYVIVILAESIRLAFKQKRLDILPILPSVLSVVHFGYGRGITLEFLFPKH